MMIHWCEICNHAQSEGVLEVLSTETLERMFMQVCVDCVNKLEETDWIENAI